MNRLLIILLLGCLAQPLCAQWKYVGFDLGAGMGWDNDALFFNAPRVAWSADVGVEYAFRRKSYLPQHLFVGLAVGLEQRGSGFEMDFDYAEATRVGSYRVLRLALPLRVGYSMPIVLKNEKMAALSFWGGLSLSVGLTGAMDDRSVSRRYDDEAVNFERHYEGGALFDHVRRADVGVAFGSSYTQGRLALSVMWRMGLRPLRRRAEALPYADVIPAAPETGHYGLERTLLLGLGYRLPLRGKIHYSQQRGAVFM